MSFHISLVTEEYQGASKMIYEPMVCLAQTMHLSCVKISSISKWTEMSFYFRVHPKQFLRLWYIRRKTCNYLASRLAQPPNKTKMRFH
jgi:hypothetical protein